MHSGVVSGPAPNAALELAKLLATLHDDKRRVTLPGFYDDVTEPSAQRRDELAALPFTDEDWLEGSETRAIGGEAGYTVLERLWLRPAAEVLTMLAGDPTGPAVATARSELIDPGRRSRTPGLSCRPWRCGRRGRRWPRGAWLRAGSMPSLTKWKVGPARLRRRPKFGAPGQERLCRGPGPHSRASLWPNST